VVTCPVWGGTCTLSGQVSFYLEIKTLLELVGTNKGFITKFHLTFEHQEDSHLVKSHKLPLCCVARRITRAKTTERERFGGAWMQQLKKLAMVYFRKIMYLLNVETFHDI